MAWMEAPWAGLMEVAHRSDLWPFIHKMGGPEHIAGVDWQKVGFSATITTKITQNRWEGDYLRAGMRDWPSHLQGLPFGPVAFQVEGNLERLKAPAIAIVGSRACTSYGRAQARQLAEAIAKAGGIVVSGLAAGIDAEAHLAAGGQTIAVVGQGLQRPMPQWQMRVRQRILAEGGLVISEFAPHQFAERWTFPVRNRVIAALAQAIVVVEAAAESGALITADHALRYGRPVMAVPGPLGASASVGCLNLISEGAQVVLGPQTLLSAIGLAERASNH